MSDNILNHSGEEAKSDSIELLCLIIKSQQEILKEIKDLKKLGSGDKAKFDELIIKFENLASIEPSRKKVKNGQLEVGTIQTVNQPIPDNDPLEPWIMEIETDINRYRLDYLNGLKAFNPIRDGDQNRRMNKNILERYQWMLYVEKFEDIPLPSGAIYKKYSAEIKCSTCMFNPAKKYTGYSVNDRSSWNSHEKGKDHLFAVASMVKKVKTEEHLIVLQTKNSKKSSTKTSAPTELTTTKKEMVPIIPFQKAKQSKDSLKKLTNIAPLEAVKRMNVVVSSIKFLASQGISQRATREDFNLKDGSIFVLLP